MTVNCIYIIFNTSDLSFSFLLSFEHMHKLKKVAQGRVWTDNDAALRDLVDAIGGLSSPVLLL